MRNYIDVLKKIEQTGVKAWLVGDTVRMIEMGVQPDYITLALDTKDLYSLALSIGTGTVDARGAYPALRGVISGIPFRAFSLRGDTIEDDLARRDLSIEAIAVRSDGGVVDPFGGRLDIRNRVIRLTGDDVDLIDQDPLRILRMLRFAAELEMDIFWKSASDVRKFLDSHADRMNGIAPERWGRELIKGMQHRPFRFMKLCDNYGLIPFFLKDLENLKNVSDGEGSNLFAHVMKTLEAIENRLDTHKFMQNDAFILAGLFSRVGTKIFKQTGERKEADRLIEEYLKSWNVPAEVISGVIAISSRYRDFYKPQPEEALCHSILKYGSTFVEIAREFALCIAQTEEFLPGYREALEENKWHLSQIIRRFNTVATQNEGSTRYLTGREIMKILNMKPGRRVGELLNDLDMAVGMGLVSSKAKAEEWLKKQA